MNAPTRRLGQDEQAALTKVFAPSFKDPDAARFKWMPVILAERGGITDYCGLVNGKNSYGGYIGYGRFYAQLRKDANGKFASGELRSVENPNREINPLDPRWLNGICEGFGYSDFSRAQ